MVVKGWGRSTTDSLSYSQFWNDGFFYHDFFLYLGFEINTCVSLFRFFFFLLPNSGLFGSPLNSTILHVLQIYEHVLGISVLFVMHSGYSFELMKCVSLMVLLSHHKN